MTRNKIAVTFIVIALMLLIISTAAASRMPSPDKLTIRVSDYFVFPGVKDFQVTSTYRVYNEKDPKKTLATIEVDTQNNLASEKGVYYYIGKETPELPKYDASGNQIIYSVENSISLDDSVLDWRVGANHSSAKQGYFHTGYFQRLKWVDVEFVGGESQDIKLTVSYKPGTNNYNQTPYTKEITLPAILKGVVGDAGAASRRFTTYQLFLDSVYTRIVI